MTNRAYFTRMEDGKLVPFNGTMHVGDVEVPIVDGHIELPDNPWWREVAKAEWELIKRYDRGEFEFDE